MFCLTEDKPALLAMKWLLKELCKALFLGFFLLVFVEKTLRAEESPEEKLNKPVLTEVTLGQSPVLPVVTVTAVPFSDLETISQSAAVLSPGEFSPGALTNSEELFQSVPNLSVAQAGSRGFSSLFGLRGLVNTQFFSEPPVAVYVDGFPLDSSWTWASQFSDLESVAVLRGHQAARFGCNSESGVILQQTQEPGNQVQGEARAAYSSYDSQEYGLSLRGPLKEDSLYLGFSGFYETRDGYVFNRMLGTHPDDREGIGGRVKLKWMPNQDWEFVLVSSQEHFDDGEDRAIPLFSTGDPFVRASGFDGEVGIDVHHTGLKATYFGEDFEVTSVSSFRSYDLDPSVLNIGFFPGTALLQKIDNDRKTFTQEVTFRSTGDEKLDVMWDAGWSYSHRDVKWRFAFPLPTLGVESHAISFLEDDFLAFYGHLSVPIQDRIRVYGGLRFDHRDREAESTFTSTTGIRTPMTGSTDFFDVAPNVGMAFDYDETLMLYLNSSYGFKSGGFVAPQLTPALLSFETERVWTTDIGFKKHFEEPSVGVNGSFFYSHVWEYQFEETDALGNYTVSNAPEVNIYGGELEVTSTPLAGLELGMGFGYSLAEFASHFDRTTRTNLNGKRVPFVPEYNVLLHAQYKHSSGFMARIEGNFYGESYAEEFNLPRFRQADYGVFNAKIGYEAEHWAMYLFGRNLTDTLYYGFKAPGLAGGTPGDPQIIGVEGRVFY